MNHNQGKRQSCPGLEQGGGRGGVTLHIYFLKLIISSVFEMVVVLSLSRVWPFVTPCNVACQAYLSFTISWSSSCPLSQWCHPTISSSVVPFFSRLQSFPPSESFPVSQFFTSGGQSIGASASASVLPMNIWVDFLLGLTGSISLLSKELSRVFSSTTVWKGQS